jgi:hypothetical protein
MQYPAFPDAPLSLRMPPRVDVGLLGRVSEGLDIRLPRCCREDVERMLCCRYTRDRLSTIKFKLRKLDPHRLLLFRKENKPFTPLIVVLGGVITPSAVSLAHSVAKNGALASISLPYRDLCSLTHHPRIASASAPFQCTAWRLQAVRTARCTMGTRACRAKAEMLVLVLAV